VLALRTATEEARSEAEAARAKAEIHHEITPGSAAAVREGPINPRLAPMDTSGTAFGKHQVKVLQQQAEIERLRAQVDRLSFLLSSESDPSHVPTCSAATSPMKPLVRKEPLRALQSAPQPAAAVAAGAAAAGASAAAPSVANL